MATLALAKDLAPHVRVNGVAPGAILWPSDDYTTLSKKEEIISKIPLRKTGTSEDVARAVGFLVKAEYVTGHVITIDGGRTLNQ